MIEKLKQTANLGNPWFAIALVLIGAIVGYGFAVSSGTASLTGDTVGDTVPEAEAPAPTPTEPEPEFPEAQNIVAPVADENVLGDADATITVITYTDFECPFCTRHHGTMLQLLEEVDDVNLVYRHYPLSFHANAQKSAEATECAADQGKFWEYVDTLFEKGADVNQLVTYAGEVGLNTATFEDCLNSGKYAQKTQDEMNDGAASGIRGTPGNIVYNNDTGEGVVVSGAQSIDRFKAAIALVE